MCASVLWERKKERNREREHKTHLNNKKLGNFNKKAVNIKAAFTRNRTSERIEFTGRQTYFDFNQNLIQYFFNEISFVLRKFHWISYVAHKHCEWRVCRIQLILKFNWVESRVRDLHIVRKRWANIKSDHIKLCRKVPYTGSNSYSNDFGFWISDQDIRFIENLI